MEDHDEDADDLEDNEAEDWEDECEEDGSSSPFSSSSLPSSVFEILLGAGKRSGVNQAGTSPRGITMPPVESTTTGV